MKLDKAIEILSDEAFNGSVTFNQDRKDAVKLGIEALKRQREDRFLNVWTFPRPLLGETEE